MSGIHEMRDAHEMSDVHEMDDASELHIMMDARKKLLKLDLRGLIRPRKRC